MLETVKTVLMALLVSVLELWAAIVLTKLVARGAKVGEVV